MVKRSSKKLGSYSSPSTPNTSHHLYVNTKKTPEHSFTYADDGLLMGSVNLKDILKRPDWFNEITMDYYRKILSEQTKSIPVVKDWKSFLECFKVLLTERLPVQVETLKKHPTSLSACSFIFYIKGENGGFLLPTNEQKEEWNNLWNDNEAFHTLSKAHGLEPNPNFLHTLSPEAPLLAIAWFLPSLGQ